MNPSREQIEKWADWSQEKDGYVRLPISAYHSIMDVLSLAEKCEDVVAAADRFVGKPQALTTAHGSPMDRLVGAVVALRRQERDAGAEG